MRALTVAALLVLSVVAHAVPAVLIVQAPVASDGDNNPNVSIGFFLSQELMDGAKVAPIVWGKEDPIFRAAIDEKLIRDSRGSPSLADVLDAANKLKADYVFVVSVWNAGSVMRARATLFRRGSVVWFDPSADTPGASSGAAQKWATDALAKAMPPSVVAREFEVSMADPENAVRSLARTWSMLLSSEAFKSLPSVPRVPTPDVEPGQMPLVNLPPPIRQVENKELMESVEALVKDRQPHLAINLLREAIDTEPMDSDRRKRLIEVLMGMDRSELAAREARAAADLLRDRPHFWGLAARAWLKAGYIDEAQADLNELVARAPENLEARLLMGEVRLRMLDPSGALDHLTAVIEASPTPEAYFLRSLANAMLGNGEAATEDHTRGNQPSVDGPLPGLERYSLIVSLTDKFGAEAGSEIRDLIPIARVRPKDAAVAARLEARWSQVLGVLALVGRTQPPDLHKPSHERQDLALKLLAQTIGDFRNFLKTGDDGLLSDATINLGEALKSFTAAREMARTEAGRR